MQMENQPIEESILESLQKATDPKGHLGYADFSRIAAFDPLAGYYAKPRNRVGRSQETDFYTAASLGKVFGKLVTAAAIDLLGSEKEAAKHVFVEIGAEPGGDVLKDVNHPFAETLVLRLGDALQIPEKAVVFANEWLDSLPFHRLRFDKAQGWQELGITIEKETIREIILPELSVPVKEIHHRLPATSSHGYLLDLPLGAVDGLRQIALQSWRGAFLTFDYGKSWEELIHNHPRGTARVYENHQSHGDLLANPGRVDLTCHLCWDFLRDVLKEEGFSEIHLERQEGFLMQHAAGTIREIIEKDARGLDQERQNLQELLHPSLMGNAFQVLAAKRLGHD